MPFSLFILKVNIIIFIQHHSAKGDGREMHPFIIQQLLQVLTELRVKIKQKNMENINDDLRIKHKEDTENMSVLRPWEKLEWLGAENTYIYICIYMYIHKYIYMHIYRHFYLYMC
jgi:hypothetical protein